MNKTLLTVLFSSLFLSPIAALAGDAAKGKDLYAQRCSVCHGADGKGDGPSAAAFPADAKPRNFQEAKFKYAVDEAKFLDLLKKGGGAVGLSPLMPPQIGLSDEQLGDLFAFVSSLKK